MLWVLAAGQAQAEILSISAPADANEGDSSTRDLTFTVSLSAAVTDTTTFTVCFTGTATIHTPSAIDYFPPYPAIPAGSDYQALQGTGSNLAVWNQNCVDSSINSNQTGTGSTQTIGIRVKGDTDAETDETVIATLSLRGTNLSVTLGTSTATHTILDDDTPAPEISVSLPISEGESRSDAGEKKVPESEGSVGIGFNLAADQPLPSALTVCVRVTESGGDRVASGSEGIQTVNMPSSVTNGSGTHTLTWTNTAADDQDSSVTVEAVAPNTVGCSAANDSYTVSSSDASDKLLIQDDENTTVELTASDPTMTEGDASDTATLTVSLSRQLYAGETIGVPIALATSTMARLPGSTDSGTANHDFTVGAAAGSGHSGVTLADALTANPRVVFTGHDTNTVQTATVTLTPVANRDDGDAAHETITATLTSLGLLDTTVSGVAAHGTNNAATLTLEDDEAPPPPATCSAQNPIFNDTSLRILETGKTTYCVRLTTAPSGGDTTVTIGRIGGGATVSPASLTFTSSNYQTPQQVTVTGADELNTHRNRTTQLTHTANGGGYSSQNLGRVRVDVDDAPEVEAFWYIKGGASGVRIRRPHTITSTRGLTPWRNAAPGERIPYAVRLSNRPEGGTVTVTATVPSDKRNLVGLSLTEGGMARDTVTVEFRDRSPGAGTGCSNWFGHQAHQYFDSHGNTRTVSGRQPSESYDGTADTPWECWRMIYVVRKDASRNIDDTCADITHTATGGGVRKVTVDTIRAHVRNPGRNRRGSRGYNSQCRNLNGNTVSAPATAAPAPTEAVANLQVTAVDDTSASVSWDAVEHATSYDVSWSAESSDALNASAGDLPGVTGTTTTIEHGAQVTMTLTVTVTPEYVDENGDTQQLASLAATATLAVGPDALSASAQSTDSPTPACVSEALMADARKAAGETWRTSPGHVERWSRVLAAFGVSNTYSNNPMTVTEAKAQTDRGLQRWVPVVAALECLEKTPKAQQAEVQVPAITVTAGAGVTEGTAASFTLKADPVPTEELAVSVTVAQTGAIAETSALGARTVTIPAGQAEAVFTVATLNDETDEPAGVITVTVNEGTGYTVEDEGAGTGTSAGGSASTVVEDDDATAVALTAPEGDLPEASGTKTLTLTLGRALLEGERLVVPLAFAGTATLGTDYTLGAPKTTPAGVTYTHLGSTDAKRLPTVTFAGAAGAESAVSATLELATVADSVAEGEQETVTVTPGTPVTTGLGGGAAASGSAGFAILEPPPEITIAAQTETVVEGTEATFTLTASRAPGADLTVHLTVTEAEGSDFVVAEQEGAATATLAQGETEATFTVPTVDDTTDEPDGVVSATLASDGEEGLHYTVAPAPEDTASVAVTDNDAASSAPTFSVGDETVNENVGMMYFTVRLDRAVQRTVKVTFTAQESTPVSARYGQDWFWWWEEGIVLTFHPGQTEKKTPVYVYNDNHDEDPETFEVALSQPTGGAAIGDGRAIGTIVNSDPMPAAWLARFGRTVAEQALDGIAGRIAAPRTAGLQGAIAGQAMSLASGAQGTHSDETGPGTSGTVNGQDGGPSGLIHAFGTGGTGHDVHGFTDQPAPSYSMTAREALLGSHFTATGETDPLGGSLAFWGRAAHSSFDGQEGTFSLDGETTSALLGIDYARSTWLLGLALIQSDGDGDYRDTDPGEDICEALDPVHLQGMDPKARAVLCSGAVREGDGEIEATLTAVMPYASIQVSQRLKLWGALGYGEGDVTLKPQTGGSLKSDIDWSMATTGIRGDVIAPQGSGLALAITSDVLWARTSSDKTHELASSDSDVTRLRLGLEGSYRIATEGGGHVTPKLELGLRQDGGDAETGFGVELGGGLTWVDPDLGLSLELSGRTLITHDSDDLEDRGFAASLLFDPKPASERGLSLVLRQEMGGPAEGGLDALFRTDPLEDRTGSGESTARWTAEAAYGMPAFSGRFTGSPHVGLDLAADTRNYSVGWRLTPVHSTGSGQAHVPGFSFGLKATRWESDAVRPEHTLGAEISMQW